MTKPIFGHEIEIHKPLIYKGLWVCIFLF